MTTSQLMYYVSFYIGFFLFMIAFMIVAIVTAKRRTAWIWYVTGATFQLVSLLGNQKHANYTGEDLTAAWIIYFVLLIGSARLIVARYNSTETRNEDSKPYKSRFTECPECGYIAVFEKECPKCGYVLSTDTQGDNVSAPPILYCRKCGVKLFEDAKACKVCGTETIRK